MCTSINAYLSVEIPALRGGIDLLVKCDAHAVWYTTKVYGSINIGLYIIWIYCIWLEITACISAIWLCYTKWWLIDTTITWLWFTCECECLWTYGIESCTLTQHEYEDIVNWYHDLAESSPIVKYIASIGKSVEGRDMPAVHITAAECDVMKIYFQCQIHASELLIILPSSFIIVQSIMIHGYGNGNPTLNNIEWLTKWDQRWSCELVIDHRP